MNAVLVLLNSKSLIIDWGRVLVDQCVVWGSRSVTVKCCGVSHRSFGEFGATYYYGCRRWNDGHFV